MNHFLRHRIVQTLVAAVLALLLGGILGGCATLPPGHLADASDPLERFNRTVFSFNDSVDRAIFRPVARGYQFITPTIVQTGVSNVFSNISDLPTAVNDLLQGKPDQAAVHIGRVAINTTFGVLGLFDPATRVGLERRRQDFGTTLGVWGVQSGPYLVLPIFGPSSVRDTVGLAADWGLDPLVYVRNDSWRYGLIGIRAVELRASVLGIEKTFDAASAIDPYLFTRDAYLARRRSGILDSRPVQASPPQDAASAPAP